MCLAFFKKNSTNELERRSSVLSKTTILICSSVAYLALAACGVNETTTSSSAFTCDGGVVNIQSSDQVPPGTYRLFTKEPAQKPRLVSTSQLEEKGTANFAIDPDQLAGLSNSGMIGFAVYPDESKGYGGPDVGGVVAYLTAPQFIRSIESYLTNIGADCLSGPVLTELAGSPQENWQ